MTLCPPPAVACMDTFTKLAAVLSEFQRLDPEITVNRLLLYVHTASKPGIRQMELEGITGLAQSSCSRAIATLSKFQGFNQAGLDLVEAVPNPQDRRHKLVALTSKGQLLAARLRQIIGG